MPHRSTITSKLHTPLVKQTKPLSRLKSQNSNKKGDRITQPWNSIIQFENIKIITSIQLKQPLPPHLSEPQNVKENNKKKKFKDFMEMEIRAKSVPEP